MTAASVLAFAGLCVLLALTPGPDTFLVLRCSLVRMRDGIAASIGSAIGSLFWAATVACGLAALLAQSAEAYRVLKVLGGLYLVYLGVSSFLASRTSSGPGEAEPPATKFRSCLLAGAVSAALNPKIGLFFLAVAPQFLPHGSASIGDTMLLGTVDAVVAVIYLSMVSVIASRAALWIRRPRVTRTLERGSAGALAALGIGTIATSAS